MKKLKWLDKGIRDIIETFQYDVYVVNIDKRIDCSCKNFTTKQGDPAHKLCLGTGQKVKIRAIKAASQETNASFRNDDASEKARGMIYYVDTKYQINDYDLIIDDNDVFIAHRVERHKGTNREHVYQRCLCVNKKTDVQAFLKNFNEIIKR